MRLLYYAHEFKLHVPPKGSGHIEAPRRLDEALAGLRETGVASLYRRSRPRPRGLDVFTDVHDPVYIKGLLSEVEVALDSYFIDNETYVGPGTQAALEALAGAAAEAVDAVSSAGGQAFVLSRPPGHHAGVSGPGLGAPSLGACLVNAAALAAVRLARRGLRVVLLDFDLAHGNGSQEIVQTFNPQGLVMLDIHQDWRRTFPWTGEPGVAGEGNVVNVNLPEGSGDDVAEAVMEGVAGLIDDIAPDVVVVSAGFGAYRGDSPLTLLNVTSSTFHTAGSTLRRRPLVAFLEGGYGAGLRRGLPSFLAGLAGEPDPVADEPTGSPPEVWEEFEKLNRDVVEYS